MLMIDFPLGLDVCLGDTWLNQHKAVTDYDNRSLLLQKGKRKYRLAFEHNVSESLPLPPPKPGDVCLLSAVQVAKMSRKQQCRRTFLVYVSQFDASNDTHNRISEWIEGFEKGFEEGFEYLPSET